MHASLYHSETIIMCPVLFPVVKLCTTLFFSNYAKVNHNIEMNTKQ